MLNNSKKVFVGLSGGVDSSVSTLLLKNAGYDVTGVFIRGWQPDWIPCTWKEDRISAMRSAAYLDIPFVTLDLEKEYRENVVEFMLNEYKKGNTPNPDMLCNREIKFGFFLKWALANGADYVATGHYAQATQTPPSSSLRSTLVRGGTEHFKKEFSLLESADKNKDQSYFLSQLTQKELKHIIFPIGHLQKSEVRKLAEEAKLPVATRKDSQGICFVGDLDMKTFLKKELHPIKGDVLDVDGKVIGQHDGAILYTIGERHGFKIFSGVDNEMQHYVVGKDVVGNTITVQTPPNLPLVRGGTEHKIHPNPPFEKEGTEHAGYRVKIKEISFTNKSFEAGDILTMRVRYRGEKIQIKVLKIEKVSENNFYAEIEIAESIVYAAGQFAVFYIDEECVGGGVLTF
jgi:tRNA-uridine 2-sulfurtransferase